ncbi:MAG TPA: hypothetical protein VG866_02545 [Candidatus Paceibacterota bacterium]|nr:hypothetical protein [Candidatus Paceibacterota bacterium]
MTLINWHRADPDFQRLKHYERKLREQEEFEIISAEIEEILIHVNHCALKLRRETASAIVMEDRLTTIRNVLELLDKRGIRVRTLKSAMS